MSKVGAAAGGKKAVGKKKVDLRFSKNKETINDLSSSLRSQAKFAKMVEYSCECVVKLCVDDVAKEEVIALGMIDTAMYVLHQNKGKDEKCQKVQKAINRMLTTISGNEDQAKMVMEQMKGDMSPFIYSLNNHDDPETLASTCEAMLALSNDRGAAKAMIDAGAIDSLAKVCKESKDPKVLAAAAKLLAKLSEDENAAQDIVKSGLVDHLLAACVAYPKDEPLQEAVSALLANIARGATPAQREDLKRKGAVDMLVNALEEFPYNENILESAAIALKYLTGASDMDVALAYFKGGNVALDEKTAKALAKVASLLLVEENVNFMYEKAGGIQWLLDLLNRAKNENTDPSKKIMAHGLRSIQRACLDEDKIYDVMQRKGVPIMQHIYTKQAKNEEVASCAANAFTAMLTRAPNAEYLSDEGVAKQALGVLRTTPIRKEHAKAALALVQAFAAFEPGAKVLNDEGAIKVILDKIKEDPNMPPDLLRHLVNTLGRLAVDEGALKEMQREGVVAECLKILKKHPNDGALCQEAMQVLETACIDPNALKELQSKGPENKKLIGTTMGNHEDNDDIQNYGQRLIDLIDDKHQKELERLKKLEEDRLAELERARKEEEDRLAELARLRKLEEDRAAAELDKLEKMRLAELERMRLEEQRRLEDEERKRQAELQRMRLEQEGKMVELQKLKEEMARKAEAERLRRLEEDARAKAELARLEKLRLERLAAEKERLRAEEERRKREDEERRLAEAERRRQQEEERLRREAERLRMEQEEMERLEMERLEMERLKAEQEAARKKALDDKKNKLANARRQMQLEMQEQEALMREQALAKKKDRDGALERAEQLRLERERQRQQELEMAEALRRMKEQEEAEKRRRDREAQARDLAESRKQAALAAAKNVKKDKGEKQFRTVKLTKSAREIFDVDGGEAKARQKAELEQWVKDFLLAGGLLTKHGDANSHQRHVFLSADLERLCWKNPKKALKDSQQIKIFDIMAVTPGRCTPNLQKKKMGKFVVKDEDSCFSITGSISTQDKHNRAESNKAERDLDLECESSESCEQWVAALEALIVYARELALWGSSTMVMQENELLKEDSD